MLKGPKAILSSAIANALGTYFEVDASTIESNLIRDAKIVLNKANLKKQTSRLALNSAGNATLFTITGGVEKVELKWEWSVGYGSQQLVKNAVLSITEANFECKLEHDEIHGSNVISSHPVDASTYVDANDIDDATQQEIKQEAGGLMGYIYKQVQMIIDNLTLKIEGLDVQIILPNSLALGSDTTEQEQGRNVILVCADELKLLSFGRRGRNGETLTNESDESKSVVKQKLSIHSFLISILKGWDADESLSEIPIIEPFSYSADVTKSGERFSGMSTGLSVQGCVEMTSSSRRFNVEEDTNSLVLYVGNQQIDTLMQLSMMVLSPPSDEISNPKSEPKDTNDLTDTVRTSFSSSASSFSFPIASISLILFENSHALHVSGVDINYSADGAECSVEASKIEYKSAEGGKAVCLGMIMTARPHRMLKFGSIQTLYLPNTLELTDSISPEISFVGNVLVVKVQEPINVLTFGSSSSSSSKDPLYWHLAPCGIDASFKEINVSRDADGSKITCKALECYANPLKTGTQLAIKCLEFRNHLVFVSNAEMSCNLPASEANTVNDFNFSVAKAEVKGGKSSEDWSEGFRPRPREAGKPNDKHPSTLMKLPNAKIGTLKLLITWSQTGISLKDVSLAIKPFHGDSKTTTNDVIHYYTSACLAKAERFISNAEVLGINVVDQTVNTIGTWSLLPFLGAGGGVVVTTGVDAIKGAVASGKRARNAEDSDEYHPGDFLRGIYHAAAEATRDGVRSRGKRDSDEGNLIDWAYGATKGTTEYVVKNKTKLGAAGTGGGGFLVGMALGGPVGAVIGGVVGNLAGGKTIEAIDSAIPKEEKE